MSETFWTPSGRPFGPRDRHSPLHRPDITSPRYERRDRDLLFDGEAVARIFRKGKSESDDLGLAAVAVKGPKDHQPETQRRAARLAGYLVAFSWNLAATEAEATRWVELEGRALRTAEELRRKGWVALTSGGGRLERDDLDPMLQLRSPTRREPLSLPKLRRLHTCLRRSGLDVLPLCCRHATSYHPGDEGDPTPRLIEDTWLTPHGVRLAVLAFRVEHLQELTLVESLRLLLPEGSTIAGEEANDVR